MANRSFPVSFALFMTPTIILFSFRMTLPALDSVLDSDRDGEIILHGIALLIGVILFFQGNRSKDHEYLRSSAIGRLNKTYSQEDAGLWSRADDALARLETKGKKSRKMNIPDRVSSINKESIELDIGKEEPEEIRVGGIEVSQNLGTERINPHPDSTLNSSSKKRGISAWLDRRAEKMARNRVKRIIEEPVKPTTIPRVCRVCGIPQAENSTVCNYCGASN